MRDALSAALGASVRRADPVRGGDVATAYRVELDGGEVVFAKTHDAAPPGFFTTEASGLEWLRAADAVPVPQVLAVSDDPAFLVLPWIDESRRSTADGEATFGRLLASMHRSGAPTFGRVDRRPTGSRSLPNDPCDTWAEFYAERRLLPLASMAEASGALAGGTIEGMRRVAARLVEVAGRSAAEPPARLHGDLWGGNRLVDVEGRSWLIDPACHGGHREFDLAMMRLFGGFGAAAFEAYDDAHPLAEGWDERVALHQIAPLAVHAIKFGGGYAAATDGAVRRYL
ncbi:phosphotransferase [Actinomarinicola tropica]|uniref:Phosphotransferase n=1 Tax=Actinomarinicola tropica TaxID=2789776 RepID=A0A5Q2RQ12_9ACTN|nr:phosphotransferase [Actinomarinicola tropica]